MTTSKSPRTVMAEALAAGKACLKPYAHRFAPKKFTQPQLFACLVLKEFEKKDYRGVCQLLADCPDLRDVIGLKVVPHWTTLQKAAARLLRAPRFRRLLAHTVRRVHGKRRRVPVAAGDSSGFDAHHASRYFVVRSAPGKKGDKTAGKQHATYRTYGKLMVVICCLSHAVLAAVASKGPTPDIDQLAGVLGHVPAWVGISAMVLDAGFDSAANHRLLREDHGIRSTIPPEPARPLLFARRNRGVRAGRAEPAARDAVRVRRLGPARCRPVGIGGHAARAGPAEEAAGVHVRPLTPAAWRLKSAQNARVEGCRSCQEKFHWCPAGSTRKYDKSPGLPELLSLGDRLGHRALPA